MNSADSGYIVPIAAFVATIGRQQRLIVETPYHPQFAPRAKLLGGRWYARLQHGERTLRAWAFDPRDSDRVADLCRELYGFDWITYATTPIGSVRVSIPRAQLGWASRIFAFGRQVCDWQSGKRGVAEVFRLGPGVLMLAGSLSDTSSTLVFELRDVPLALYEQQRDAVERCGYDVELVQETVPQSLPVSRSAPSADDGVSATMRRILDLWDTLSAREQAALLEELLRSAPSVAGR